MTRDVPPLRLENFKLEVFYGNGLDAVTGMLNSYIHGSSGTFGYVPLKVSNEDQALTALKFLGQGLTSNVYELNGGYVLKAVKSGVCPGYIDVLRSFNNEYIMLERIRRALQPVDTAVAGDLRRHTIQLANEFVPNQFHGSILVTYPVCKSTSFPAVLIVLLTIALLEFSWEDLVGDAFANFLRFLFFLHHTVGVCHLDPRISNLMINGGHIVLLDYGFACDSSSEWHAGALSYLPGDMQPSMSAASYHHDLVALVHALYVHKNKHPAKVDQRDSTPSWNDISEDRAWYEPRQLARDAKTQDQYLRLGKFLDSLLLPPH
jgi:serine/threonine protein kinase